MKTLIVFVQFTLAILWVDSVQAMNPFRKAFVFFAVQRDNTVIAVQSNPLMIADDSEGNDNTLLLVGVFTMPAGGGTPVPGVEWENGSSYGGVSSEGQVYPVGIPEEYWAANATLYARFTLVDTDDASFLNGWDTPIFLRSIEHINFFFLQNGTGAPQNIPGSLPTSPPYYYTGFTWSPTPFGGLAGADLSFQHTDSGRTAALQVSGNPLNSWAQDEAPFDLTIVSESDNSDNTCVAEFRGLSWDGLETPTPAAQPSLSLRRLQSDGVGLEGYYWIRGQTQGGTAINTVLPVDAEAKAILQYSPLTGETLSLNADCSLEGLNFTPSYPTSNTVLIEVTSNTNSFQGCLSESLMMEFREFDVDYTPTTDWYLPYATNPASIPESDRTISIEGTEVFDWTEFNSDFSGGSTLSVEGSTFYKQEILLTWPVGGTVDDDSGYIDITLETPFSGIPESNVSLDVIIGGKPVDPGDINGDGNIDLEDVILGLHILVGLEPADVHDSADISEDGKIGLAEVIHCLDKIAHGGR